MRTLILRDMNKTFLLSALAVLALTGVGLLVTVGSVGGTKQAGAQQGLTLALDMDITHGGPVPALMMPLHTARATSTTSRCASVT